MLVFNFIYCFPFFFFSDFFRLSVLLVLVYTVFMHLIVYLLKFIIIRFSTLLFHLLYIIFLPSIVISPLFKFSLVLIYNIYSFHCDSVSTSYGKLPSSHLLCLLLSYSNFYPVIFEGFSRSHLGLYLILKTYYYCTVTSK